MNRGLKSGKRVEQVYNEIIGSEQPSKAAVDSKDRQGKEARRD